MNVLIIGTLAFDYIMNFSGRFADRIMEDKIHSISLSFLVDKLSKQYGGTSANIAYTLKLLGTEPLIFVSAGNDFSAYKTYLQKKKISTKYISLVKDVPTSSYFVVTDQDNNQIGSFYIGASKYAAAKSLQEVNEHIDLAIIAPTIPQAMKKAVNECQAGKIPYIYDPAFQIAIFTKEELKTGITGAKFLIGNDYEISMIEDKLEVSHEELVAMVPAVITTIGDKGSIIETRTESIHIKPAKPKSTTDPTGAGDAYRAGFIAGYVRGYPLDICGQMGSVAAVYTVETYGTQTHSFTKKEFVERYEENYHSVIRL